MIDTIELRRMAMNATPGPWIIQYGDDAQFMCMTAISSANLRSSNKGQFTDAELRKIVAVSFHQGYPDAGAENDEANSEFIAAANPATVLALLDEIDRSRGTIDIVSAALFAAEKELAELRTIEDAARNLAKVKGRHNSELAMNQLLETLK